MNEQDDLACTELFKLIKDYEIELGNGMSIPIEHIIEQEARARAEALIGEHLEIRQNQQNIERVVKESLMKVRKANLEADLPV